MEDTNVRSSWQTLKILGGILMGSLTLGSVVVAVTLYIGSGPTREEFDKNIDRQTEVTDGIEKSITNVEKEQIRMRGSYDSLDERQKRIEQKLDVLIQNVGRRR